MNEFKAFVVLVLIFAAFAWGIHIGASTGDCCGKPCECAPKWVAQGKKNDEFAKHLREMGHDVTSKIPVGAAK